ncbi:hypothetical protein E2493_04435 [Sphingomonas parva]|uniref:VTT domain-containing protein n=1 Tax=Sphingomonas parva TaxID=2555898 RepID=A0A4Y8ZY30_9SPHN|nr:VTT domain-containing protein [Sphingomonas parva]TFI59446.1 hypothetical protein E2493_04435 [Sphingomonas parva]
MEIAGFDWTAIESLGAALAFAESEAAVAGAFFLGTTALVACCVPGGIAAMAISAAALLETWLAIPAVALGALAASQILFLGIRRIDGGRTRARLGARLQTFEQRFARYGPWYIVGLRMFGAPHFLVTAASALLPLRAGVFAAATIAGFLPGITLAAAAGSAL